MRAFLPTVPLVFQATKSLVINNPSAGTVWLDGSTNAIEWSIGVEELKIFDVELVRLGSSGIKYVAENVSVAQGALNVNIQSLPPANDYHVVFLEAGAGVTYSISSKFTITDSKDTANGKPVPNKPTASIVGAPNPTETWALRFNSNGNAIGAAAGSPVPGPHWWIGALGLLGAGAMSLLL